MVEGISHLTFIVKDLTRASTFFQSVFAAEEIYTSDQKFSLSNEVFFLVGGQWVAIMQGDELKDRTYNHVAFKISEEDFEDYESRVVSLGLDIRPARSRIEGEGRSLYFYDYDNHLFELHTGTLGERLRSYGASKP